MPDRPIVTRHLQSGVDKYRYTPYLKRILYDSIRYLRPTSSCVLSDVSLCKVDNNWLQYCSSTAPVLPQWTLQKVGQLCQLNGTNLFKKGSKFYRGCPNSIIQHGLLGSFSMGVNILSDTASAVLQRDNIKFCVGGHFNLFCAGWIIELLILFKLSAREAFHQLCMDFFLIFFSEKPT